MSDLNVKMVDPALILADSNTRFGLKASRIEKMKQSILDAGRIETPLRVSEIASAPGTKHKYRLNQGHYRLAAAMELNEKDNAGIEVPIQIVEPQEGVERLKRQASENLDRENLTPMDTAVMIRDMMAAGMKRMEIMTIFSRPGGRKGAQNTPASNSFLNIHLSFLEFPKHIQERLHDGRLTVGGAMRLLKAPKEKWQTILETIEADRIAAIEAEEKEDTRLAEEEKKVIEATEKAEGLKTDLDKKQAEVETLAKETAAKVDEMTEKFKLVRQAKTPDERKKLQETFKAAEADAQGAEKKLEAAKKEVEKVKSASEKAADQARSRAEALRKRREAQSAKKFVKKATGASDVDKAARKAEGGPVPLSFVDMRAAVSDIAKCSHPKVKEIGAALLACFSGEKTTQATVRTLAELTGEVKAKAAKK